MLCGLSELFLNIFRNRDSDIIDIHAKQTIKNKKQKYKKPRKYRIWFSGGNYENDSLDDNNENKIHIKLNEDIEYYTLETLENLNIKLQYLENITYQDTVIFIPPVNYGKVVKVYDGDTITIATKLPFDNSPIYRFSVRLAGIDCPEIKSKFANEKKLAIESKDILSNKLMNKNVILKNVSFEKYGRLLADIYVDDLHINKWMIDNCYAVPYDGGKKQRPDDWNSNF